MTNNELIEKIVNRVGSAVILEQLAEEATELAHASLKLARIIRGVNPTPVTREKANNDLIEEFNDVSLLAYVFNLSIEEDIINKKILRWANRLGIFENNES